MYAHTRKFRAKRRTAHSVAECGHGVIKPPGARQWYFQKLNYPCTICPKCDATGPKPDRKMQVVSP